MLIEVPLTRCTGKKLRLINLLGTSVKVQKSLVGDKVMTPIMYLAPHKKLALALQDGRCTRFNALMHAVCAKFKVEYGDLRRKVIKHNSCPGACTCPEVCLATYSGNLRLRDQQEHEMLKTLLWLANPDWFLLRLQHEIATLDARCSTKRWQRAGVKYEPKEVAVHVRLNGGSDIDFVNQDYVNPIRLLKDVQFYDYTKVYSRMRNYLDGKLYDNYHLTWSAGSRDVFTNRVMQRGGNVAVVFKNFPEMGLKVSLPDCPEYTVIDGTISDARVLDPERSIVALKPLGPNAQKVDIKKQDFIFNSIEEFKMRMRMNAVVAECS